MSEEKQVYSKLLNDINEIISKLNEINKKCENLSNSFSGNYVIDDKIGGNDIIYKNNVNFNGINDVLLNNINVELSDKINQINN